MEGYNDCDDLDDDWFYGSLTRYNMLQMFYLHNVPKHVLQLDEFTLCLASTSQKFKSMELSSWKLPTKLILPAEDEGRSKENDLKMIYGTYTEERIQQMGVLRVEKKVITSQASKKGLQIYSLQSDNESGAGESVVFADTNLNSPNFAVNGEDKKLICSTCRHRPFVLCDLNLEEVIKEINHPFYEATNNKGLQEDLCVNNIKCALINKNTLSVLDTKNGKTALIDLRTENTISILENSECKENELWTLSDCDFNISSNYFGILSNKGNLYFYDTRNNKKCMESECFSSEGNNVGVLKLKMGSEERFSISGIDSNVYVYNVVKNRSELLFTHDGHFQKTVSYDIDNIVNDHIWIPSLGENYLISICNNKSMNFWQYNL